MVRFILVSFAVLAWLFYEMSGGSDFVPFQAREISPSRITQTVLDGAQPASSDAQPQAPVSLSLASVEDVLSGGTTQPARTVAPLEDDDADAETATPAPDVPNTVLDVEEAALATAITDALAASEDTPIVPEDAQEALPSILDLGAGLALTTLPETLPSSSEETADIRRVTGDRVNVRGGPGTSFDVVFQLLRDDTVEVLEDGGDGWVRMRAVASGDDGWIADFLLE